MAVLAASCGGQAEECDTEQRKRGRFWNIAGDELVAIGVDNAKVVDVLCAQVVGGRVAPEDGDAVFNRPLGLAGRVRFPDAQWTIDGRQCP